MLRGTLALENDANTDVDRLTTFGKMALGQGWYAQELDCRPPHLDDEPARLALPVDLRLTEWKSHRRELHGGVLGCVLPKEAKSGILWATTA